MTSQPSDAETSISRSATVKVCDLLVRVVHWTIAVAFFIAYFTEDDVLMLHVWAGYTIGILIMLPILWGFVGPRHARFSDFLYSPFGVWRYMIELIGFRAKRYRGGSVCLNSLRLWISGFLPGFSRRFDALLGCDGGRA